MSQHDFQFFGNLMTFLSKNKIDHICLRSLVLTLCSNLAFFVMKSLFKLYINLLWLVFLLFNDLKLLFYAIIMSFFFLYIYLFLFLFIYFFSTIINFDLASCKSNSHLIVLIFFNDFFLPFSWNLQFQMLILNCKPNQPLSSNGVCCHYGFCKIIWLY
jgi:hypothetical protein